MEYFDSTKMPTPLMAFIITLSNIFFTVFGGVIIYLWQKMNDNSMSLIYELLIVTCGYITFLIISYVLVRAIFNRYIHFLHLRLFVQHEAYDQIP